MLQKVLKPLKNFKREFFRDSISEIFLGIETGELILATVGLYLAIVSNILLPLDITIESLVFVSSIILSYLIFQHKPHEDLMALFRCSFSIGLLGIIITTGICWSTLAIVFTVIAVMLIVACCIISHSGKEDESK